MEKSNNGLKSATGILYGIGEAINIINAVVYACFIGIFIANLANGGQWFGSETKFGLHFETVEEYLLFCEFALIFCILFLAIKITMCVIVKKVYKTMEENQNGPHVLMLVLTILGGIDIFNLLASIFGIVCYNKKN